jgi:hypothetical protein
MEADLLVAAVPLIDGVEEHVQPEWKRLCPADLLAAFEGLIAGRVVDDEDFDVIVVCKPVRDTGENILDRALRVVRDDEDQQARFCLVQECGLRIPVHEASVVR